MAAGDHHPGSLAFCQAARRAVEQNCPPHQRWGRNLSCVYPSLFLLQYGNRFVPAWKVGNQAGSHEKAA